MKLSPHFSDFEFRCHCCGSLGPEGISPDLLEALEALRKILKKPIWIASGYRCPKYNKRVGGARKSQHMRGTAADIIVRRLLPRTVALIAEDEPFQRGGVGRYCNFTHVDARGRKARWKGF